MHDACYMHLWQNSFATWSCEDKIAVINVFGWHVKIPNTAQRRRALPLHDRLHFAMCFGTDELGEWKLAGWEARTGLPGYGLFIHLLVFQTLVLGLLFAPCPTLASWRAAGGQRSLSAAPLPAEVLERITLGELRDHLGVPAQGNVTAAPRLHPYEP